MKQCEVTKYLDRGDFFNLGNIKKQVIKPETYNIYLCVQNINEKYNYVFNNTIWKLIIKCIIYKANFVEFSCIEEDKDLIEEIYSNTKDVKEVFNWKNYIENSEVNQEDIMHQISYRGEIIPNTCKLILNNYLKKGKNIKWFYVNLLEEDADNAVIFSGNHNGQEYYINSVTLEELESIKKIAVENNLFIKVD